ncbi:MAG: ATP-binding protein [Pseudonocardiales bacterium]
MTALIVFAGLPGSGKTTLSRVLARHMHAAMLRVDLIEAAVVRSGLAAAPVGPIGYAIVHGLAADCLRAGTTVIVDAVNPVPEARQGWPVLAAEVGVPLRVIEVTLHDAHEHRRRIEHRHSDVPGLVVPTWEQVLASGYQPWQEDRDGPRLIVDGVDTDGALRAIRRYVGTDRA